MRNVLQSPIFLVGFLFFIFITNFIGNLFYWTWEYAFYDVVLHILGGIWIAALLFYIVQKNTSLFNVWHHKIVTLVCVLGITALIAVGWEWFEFLLDAMFGLQGSERSTQPGLEDTMFDFLFGILGSFAYAASFLFLSQKKKTSFRSENEKA